MFKKVISFSLFLFLIELAASAAHAAGTSRVRIMAGNLTSGNYQSYEEYGIRIFQGLDPDVVLIQEFNVGGNTTGEINAFVQAAFGAGYDWFREPGSDQIPNGIISRWPIIASGQWVDDNVSNRDFAWARIDIPGDVDLWVVSVHFLTTSATNRSNQAKDLVESIEGDVPAEVFLVIGGDLNTGSRSESAVQRLSAVVETSGPYPSDSEGDGTNANREKPYDWVLPEADLEAYSTDVKIGVFTFPNGLVFDSRVYTQNELDANFSPVRAGDSGIEGMQHMAVVRDFLVPSGSAGPMVDWALY